MPIAPLGADFKELESNPRLLPASHRPTTWTFPLILPVRSQKHAGEDRHELSEGSGRTGGFLGLCDSGFRLLSAVIYAKALDSD